MTPSSSHDELRQRYGRVAVVMGGDSRERQVSLWSGAAVLEALVRVGVDAHPVDGVPALLAALSQRRFDRVFIILHGPGGEDGTLQGALEALRVPYTGSGVLGSALGMDKIRTKQVWQNLQLPTAPFRVIEAGDSANSLMEHFGLPMVLKPSAEGSTFGVTLARTPDEVELGLANVRKIGGEALVERLIEGSEYTVSVLQHQGRLRALPVIKIVPASEFYDFDAKYLSDATQYLIPSGLSESLEGHLQRTALAAFSAIGASAWGRIDFMVDRAGEPFMLEANTAPGMTSHSLVPKAAAAVGIDFASLCLAILDTSFRD
jgi:D-alanine-D-alanine ligase